MMMSTPPLLSIAIPTWNRAPFLSALLGILQQQRIISGSDKVEILVCDNHSDDATADIVAQHQQPGAAIRYICHPENLGSDYNIATCHNQAHGKYVWILGDDDIPLEGALATILKVLETGDIGLLFLRTFGFEKDPLAELPPSGNGDELSLFSGVDQFLNRIGACLTLISAMIYQRTAIAELDARKYCGSNLVQVGLYLGAAQHSQSFACFNRYLLAYRKNNGRPYDFSQVFVENMHNILLQWQQHGFPLKARLALERRMLIQYFPQGVVAMRRDRSIDVRPARARFRKAYHDYLLYWLIVEPILTLPRIVAVPWGLLCVVLGRAVSGDLMRGLYYLRHRLG